MRDRDRSAIVDALARAHPLFAERTIERWVTEESHRYDDASIQSFVPILVQRTVHLTLLDLETADGLGAGLPLVHDD